MDHDIKVHRAAKIDVTLSNDSDIDLSGFDPAQQQKLIAMAHHVRGILDTLGLDTNDPNLAETDIRVAKMYLEMFHGLAQAAEPKVTTFPNEEGYSHMVM